MVRISGWAGGHLFSLSFFPCHSSLLEAKTRFDWQDEMVIFFLSLPDTPFLHVVVSKTRETCQVGWEKKNIVTFFSHSYLTSPWSHLLRDSERCCLSPVTLALWHK